jgi:hypothetical protein
VRNERCFWALFASVETLFFLHGASFSNQRSESAIFLYGYFCRFACGRKPTAIEELVLPKNYIRTAIIDLASD